MRVAIFLVAGVSTVGCTSLAGPQELSSETLAGIRLSDSNEQVTLSQSTTTATPPVASASPSTDSQPPKAQPTEVANPLTLTEKKPTDF